MDTSASANDWRAEANAIIRDIEQHVHKISISNLPNSHNKILFNMTTLERKDFCVELTKQGFRIVGEKYDSEDKKGKYSVYETPYSMLDNLSPAYRDSFGEELFEKLKNLKVEREGRGAEAHAYSSDEDDEDDENAKSNEKRKLKEKGTRNYENEKKSKQYLKITEEKKTEENTKSKQNEKETEGR